MLDKDYGVKGIQAGMPEDCIVGYRNFNHQRFHLDGSSLRQSASNNRERNYPFYRYRFIEDVLNDGTKLSLP